MKNVFDIFKKTRNYVLGIKPVSTKKEKNTILISRTKFCEDILDQKSPTIFTEEENYEFILSLQTILEIGLNSLFRDVVNNSTSMNFVKETNLTDSIDYIEKIKSTICFWEFDVKEHENFELNDKSRKLLEDVSAFTKSKPEIFNGHSIVVEKKDEGKSLLSNIKKFISSGNIVQSQTGLFLSVVEGVSFFVYRAVLPLSDEQKKEMIESTFTPDLISKLKNVL